MGILSFFGFYGKSKVKEVAESVTSTIVGIDPEGASEAQLNMMLQKLTEISKKVAQYQRAYERDLKETEEVENRLNRAVSALQILEKDLESATGSRANEIGSAMDRLLDEVDKLDAEVEREKSEDRDAKEILDTYQKAEKDLANKIRKAKDSLKKLSTQIDQAKVRKEMAEEKLKAQKESSGFDNSLNSLDIANSYMEKELQKIQDEESAMRSQAELLKGDEPIDNDDIIAQALRKADGDSGDSRSERLKKLRERRGL